MPHSRRPSYRKIFDLPGTPGPAPEPGIARRARSIRVGRGRGGETFCDPDGSASGTGGGRPVPAGAGGGGGRRGRGGGGGGAPRLAMVTPPRVFSTAANEFRPVSISVIHRPANHRGRTGLQGRQQGP